MESPTRKFQLRSEEELSLFQLSSVPVKKCRLSHLFVKAEHRCNNLHGLLIYDYSSSNTNNWKYPHTDVITSFNLFDVAMHVQHRCLLLIN